MTPTSGFDELFDREYARLVGALGVAFNAEDAADAVQEAFIEADRRWKRVGRYDDPAGWVRHVALNRLRNGKRNRRRREEILATVRPVPNDDLTEALLDLRDAIDLLPEAMRLSVCLHYLAGHTVEEVAHALGSAPGTVKSNLHAARQRLRKAEEAEQHG